MCCLWNVPSREIAGWSSASSSDRKCCMSDLMYLSAVLLITEACIQAENCSREDVDLPRKLHILFVPSVAIRSPFITPHNISMFGCSRDISWLFSVRDSRWVLVETNTSLRSVVGGHFFIDCLPTHNTGRQHQANFPSQGGGKFRFEIWWKCTSKRAQQFLFVILMGT